MPQQVARDRGQGDLIDPTGMSPPPITWLDAWVFLRRWGVRLCIVCLTSAVAGLAISYVLTPMFTARATFLPPLQQQSGAGAALAQLGALAGLAGSYGVGRSPGEQYVALMQSTSLQDRLLARFDLLRVYDVDYRFEARRALQQNVRIQLGKKDGLISVEVDDADPARAAAMANAHIEELRALTDRLAVTEAQQRRKFFQAELERSKERLTAAQRSLQASGYDQAALRAEPKAAADSFARLKAELTAAEVRLQALRSNLNSNTPEVIQQQATVAALRRQLATSEESMAPKDADGDYIGRYREFKYEETLFDLFARQYELARLDESREGALIQVVDVATPPEWKSKPSRFGIALGTAAAVTLLIAMFLWVRDRTRIMQRLAAASAGSDTVLR